MERVWALLRCPAILQGLDNSWGHCMSGASARWEGHPQFGEVSPCWLAWLEESELADRTGWGGMGWDRAGWGELGMPGSSLRMPSHSCSRNIPGLCIDACSSKGGGTEEVAGPPPPKVAPRAGLHAERTGTRQLGAGARERGEQMAGLTPRFSWAAPPSAMSIMTRRSSWRAARRRQTIWKSWSMR